MADSPPDLPSRAGPVLKSSAESFTTAPGTPFLATSRELSGLQHTQAANAPSLLDTEGTSITSTPKPVDSEDAEDIPIAIDPSGVQHATIEDRTSILPEQSSEPLHPTAIETSTPTLPPSPPGQSTESLEFGVPPPPGLRQAPFMPENVSVALPSARGPSSPSETLLGTPEKEKVPEKRRVGLRRRVIFLLVIVAFIIIVLAVVLPTYFLVVRPHQRASPSNGSGLGGAGSTIGGNGSTVFTTDGSSFTYINPFGGYWVYDLNDPFNNNARPNTWTPPLNTTWTWGTDKVYGVNLGGLFVLEPFISPALFQKYPGAIDEWTLSQLMAADTANGGLNQLEEHYNTFITEQDIAEIAGAGLNWIRLPIPFWAIEKWDFEPFLEKVCWPYILRVLQWARKYGLRVNLDLHTIPGSQNGYNHSGKEGNINFLSGVMGVANAERALNYIRIITEFISQPEWQPVVPVFSIVNEALVSTIGTNQITSFYLRAHDMIRNITGYGAGQGPYIAIHDGFEGVSNWAGFLQGADRIMLDTHPYFAFDGQTNWAPIATGVGLQAGGPWPQMACSAWGPPMNQSAVNFGVTVAGEFSGGYNNCGLFLTGVGNTGSYGDSCALFLDASQWNATVKAGVQAFTMASMDALQDWFFWTWKIGNSTSNRVESPLWSYKLGLEQGWIPVDPRTALGTCAALGVSGPSFSGTFQPWQTGGAGAGTIAASSVSSFGHYPPTPLSGIPSGANQAFLPTYTMTGPVQTLPPPTFSPSPHASVSVGNGWYDAADKASAPTMVAGCSYPDAWNAVSAAVPTAPCPATATATNGGVGVVVTPSSTPGRVRR